MGGCMCFGRPPASKLAVKRYNLLVPDIFPIKPPRVDEDLPAAVIKKIEKLGEYLSKNQQRATKVSRRLYRRICKELSRRDPCTGYIKIAVHAYTYLLAQDNVNFYTLELIKRDDSVIRVLLDHHNVHMRILGAELLAHFLRQQNDADNLNAVMLFTPTLCKNCRKVMPLELENVEEKNKIELRVACLRGLREHVGLLQRLSADPNDLDQILAGVLDNLECMPVPVSVPVPEETIQTCQSEEMASPRALSSPVARLRNMSARRHLDRQKSTSMDFKFFQKLKIPEDFASASTPSQVASQVMTEIGSLTKAAGNAEAVLECLLQQLDQRNDWSDAETVQTVFSMMRDAYARQHQQFLLFTVLLRHAAAASALPIIERTSLIQLSIEEGLMQDIHLSTSVLVHCLAHLPRQLPPPALRQDGLIQIAPDTKIRQAFSHPRPVSVGMKMVERHPLGDSPTKIGDPAEFILRDTILHGVGRIAERVEGAMQLVDTLLGLFKKFNWPVEEEEHAPGEEIPILECVLAAAEAACTFPDKTGRLPFRKYEQALQELFALVMNVSSYARALANKLIRLVLPLAPNPQHVLPVQLTTAFLSTMYYELEDPKNLPELYAELGAVFEALMFRSQAKSSIAALQLVHTLWGEAIEPDKAGRLAALDAPHRCAILMLCRSMVSIVNDVLQINIDASTWTASLEPVMQSSLRLENAVLLGITADFPSSLHQPCALFLKGAVPVGTVVQEIVVNLEGYETWQQEFPQGISAHLSPPFIPSNLMSLQFGTKPLPLSTGSSLGSSAAHSEVEVSGLHLSQQVASLLQVSPSGKHGYNQSIEVDSHQGANLGDIGLKGESAYTLDQVLEMVDSSSMFDTGNSVKEGLDFNDLQLDINPIGP